MSGLDRFVAAQDGVYPQALAELEAGAKRSHWMWYVFPQLAGLGRSDTARFYGLADVAAARAYLAHPLLGPRLAVCTRAMLDWTGRRSAAEILGEIDALKFASSMTLFEATGSVPACAHALEAFYAGRRDPLTLDLLAGQAKPGDPV